MHGARSRHIPDLQKVSSCSIHGLIMSATWPFVLVPSVPPGRPGGVVGRVTPRTRESGAAADGFLVLPACRATARAIATSRSFAARDRPTRETQRVRPACLLIPSRPWKDQAGDSSFLSSAAVELKVYRCGSARWCLCLRKRTSRVAQFELARKRTRQSKCRHSGASSRAKVSPPFHFRNKKKFRSFQKERKKFRTVQAWLFGVHEFQKKSTGALLIQT